VGLEHVPLAACIRNLVMNAINHHHLPNGVVTVDARIEDDLLCVVVTDDGPGIPKEFFEQIFEPFRSLSTTTSAPRSGLGLALVRRMADLVDGHIDVVSIEGKGSTFTLWWPMEAPKQIEGEQGEAASSDIAGGGGRRDRSGADPTIVVEGAHR